MFSLTWPITVLNVLSRQRKSIHCWPKCNQSFCYQFIKTISTLKSVSEQKQSVTKENCYSSVNIAKSTLGPKDEISFFNKIGALKGFRRKDEYVQKRPYCPGGGGEGLQHSTWFIQRALWCGITYRSGGPTYHHPLDWTIVLLGIIINRTFNWIKHSNIMMREVFRCA